MKNTFLIFRDSNAEKKELVIATKEQWHLIMEQNKGLPVERRRFFMKSSIIERDEQDVMYVEVCKQEYDRWHRENQARYADHVGIVEKIENGLVYTIEGNTSDSCAERWYPIGDACILGYGAPAYE